MIRANWKIAQEAFCEAFHVERHPPPDPPLPRRHQQPGRRVGHVHPGHHPGGTPSPLLDWEPDRGEMLRSMLDVRVDQDAVRHRSARARRPARPRPTRRRERWRPVVGDRVDERTDAEMMDSLDYTLFPNFHPWGAFNRIVYRFRPNGDDHRSSIMEVLFLAPFKGERPPPAPVHLPRDRRAVDRRAGARGCSPRCSSRTRSTWARCSSAWRATSSPGSRSANYQETKVRWSHQLLGEWMRRTGMNGMIHPVHERRSTSRTARATSW